MPNKLKAVRKSKRWRERKMSRFVISLFEEKEIFKKLRGLTTACGLYSVKKEFLTF